MHKKSRIVLMTGILSGFLVTANAQADHNVRYIIIDNGYTHDYGDHRWAKKQYKHHKKHHDEYRHGGHHYRNKYRRDYHDYERHHPREAYDYRPDRPHHYRSRDSHRPYRSDSRIGGHLVIDF